jgi:hypothetical protein
VQAKGQPAASFVDAVGDQRIAGRSSYPLAHPVGKAHAQHPGPGIRNVQERLGQGGQRVASHHQPLAFAQAVAQPAGEGFEQTGGRLSDPLNQADGAGPHTQHVGQKEGDEIDDHLAGDVSEEAGGGDYPHVARQVTQ